MSSTTVLLDNGPLAEVDLVALGAASGMLWRSPEITVVGIGPAEHIPLRLGTSVEAVTAHLHDLSGTDDVGRAGTGPVGFVTLPFDRDADGLVLVPSVVLGESGGIRFATALDGRSIDSIGTEVDALLSEPISSRPTEVTVHLGRTAEAWRDDVVAIARDRIASSELQKAVLARELVLTANADFSLARIVASLAERFAEAMVFSIDGFVGASPELLVSRIDRIVRAHPLAGTAARSTDPDVDAQQIASLHASAKDRVEHQITIDWLLTELLPFCSYVDAEPEPSTLTLANVHHLGTLVEGVLSEPAASILDLVDAVHPTPALGGAPQADAVELIEELEGFDRGRYGGPSGWVDSSGNGQFAVSVRTAQVRANHATIAAGVGVVAQSDPQAELEETQAKFRAMLGTFLGA